MTDTKTSRPLQCTNDDSRSPRTPLRRAFIWAITIIAPAIDGCPLYRETRPYWPWSTVHSMAVGFCLTEYKATPPVVGELKDKAVMVPVGALVGRDFRSQIRPPVLVESSWRMGTACFAGFMGPYLLTTNPVAREEKASRVALKEVPICRGEGPGNGVEVQC